MHLNSSFAAIKSARGLAHSKTLARVMVRKIARQVLECASPLALCTVRAIAVNESDTAWLLVRRSQTAATAYAV